MMHYTSCNYCQNYFYFVHFLLLLSFSVIIAFQQTQTVLLTALNLFSSIATYNLHFLLNSATIWLLNDKTDELWSKVADGVPLIRIPKSTGVVGEVIKNGIMLNVPDAYQHSNFNKSVDQRTGYKTTSILCVEN